MGAAQLTLAVSVPPAAPGLASPIAGAPGTVAGVTWLDNADAALLPTELTATTRNTYVVPLVSPVTTLDVAVAAIPVTVRTRAAPPVPVRTCTWTGVGLRPPVPPVRRPVARALPPAAGPMVGVAGAGVVPPPAPAVGVTGVDAAENAPT